MKYTGEKIRKYCYTNPKTKEVVAGYSDYLDMEEEVSRKCSCPTSFIFRNIYLSGTRVDWLSDVTFKTIAKCDDVDSFDERIGKSVAISKLDAKYHKAMAKRYEKVIKIIEKAKKELETLLNYHIEKAEHCMDSIKKYLPEDGE